MTFSCDNATVALLDKVLAGESSVIWTRHGERRLIPGAMIRNARQTMESWLQMYGRDLEQVPSKLTVIRWEDCLGLPESTSTVKVDVALNEVPNPVESEGDASPDGGNHHSPNG